MIRPITLALALALPGIFCGCSTLSPASRTVPAPAATSPDRVAADQLRSNATGLLYDLLENEKNVSKIFVIKDGSKEVVMLIQLISATATVDEKELVRMSRSDPALNLKFLDLPPGETAARKAEAKSEEYDLLLSTGVKFQFNLLLTQAQAENYGSHLAKVAAENSSRPAEKKTFTDISQQMQHLYEQTIQQMRSLPSQ